MGWVKRRSTSEVKHRLVQELLLFSVTRAIDFVFTASHCLDETADQQRRTCGVLQRADRSHLTPSAFSAGLIFAWCSTGISTDSPVHIALITSPVLVTRPLVPASLAESRIIPIQTSMFLVMSANRILHQLQLEKWTGILELDPFRIRMP